MRNESERVSEREIDREHLLLMNWVRLETTTAESSVNQESAASTVSLL